MTAFKLAFILVNYPWETTHEMTFYSFFFPAYFPWEKEEREKRCLRSGQIDLKLMSVVEVLEERSITRDCFTQRGEQREASSAAPRNTLIILIFRQLSRESSKMHNLFQRNGAEYFDISSLQNSMNCD